MSSTALRRLLLSLLVAVSAANCAMTQDNRLWDLAATGRSLNSPEMNAAIAAAKPGEPR